MISYQIPHSGSADGLTTDFMETENLPRKLPPASYPKLNICYRLTHSSPCLADSERSRAVKSARGVLEFCSAIYSWLILDKLLNFSKADSTFEEIIFRGLVPGWRRHWRKMYTQYLTLSEFLSFPPTRTEWWQGLHERCRQWGIQCILVWWLPYLLVTLFYLYFFLKLNQFFFLN